MTTPSALLKGASRYFIEAQPPLLSQEGNNPLRAARLPETSPAALASSAPTVRSCEDANCRRPSLCRAAAHGNRPEGACSAPVDPMPVRSGLFERRRSPASASSTATSL